MRLILLVAGIANFAVACIPPLDALSWACVVVGVISLTMAAVGDF